MSMLPKILIAFHLIAFILGDINAQCGDAYGLINDTTTSYIPLHVFGANNNELSSQDQCVSSVYIHFVHSRLSNLNMFLMSPDSTVIQLIGPVVNKNKTSNTIWKARFRPTHIVSCNN